MYTIEECIIFWHPNELVRADRADLEKVRISEEAIEFMTTIGLPQETYGNVRFSELKNPLVPVEKYVISDHFGQTTIPINSPTETYYVIGQMGPISEKLVWIPSITCINVTDGKIVGFRREGETFFLNSSIISLFQFLSVWKAEWQPYSTGDKERNIPLLEQYGYETEYYEQLAQHIQEIMIRLDPVAMENDNYFWPKRISEIT